VTIDVPVARTAVLKAFVEVETCWAGTFEEFVAIEPDGVVADSGEVEGFENGTISKERSVKRWKANLFSGFRTFNAVLVNMVPDED